uniref:Target of rapamycin complex subunit lst8 n=1 Tax=Angiostrongylus cantonensis TaxID=6313 RepID=A0A158P5X5_ANGCA
MDGHSLMASASYDQTIRIWDVGSSKHVATIPHSDSQVNAMAFTPNGYQLAIAAFQKVKIYDMTSLKPANHISPIVCFEQIMKNAQSRWMYTGGEDHSCRVYEMRVNQLVCQRVFDNLDPVTSVVIHGNQVELFIADQAGQVYIWDLRRDAHIQMPMPPLSYQEFVTSLAIHPLSNTLAGITNRGYLIVWDLSNGSDEWAQKKYVEKTTDTLARLQNNDTGKRAICKSYGLSCRYSPDGQVLVTTGSDNMIHILDVRDHAVKASMDAGCDWNWDSAFTCDSRVLFTGGSDSRIKLWDMDSGQIVLKYDGHTKPITSLCISDVPLRDNISRVKHLKNLLDSLSTQEKRQLIEEHSFETFHLVDELLLSADIVANPQGAVEGESGLWTLEQVLCFAPELVGNGWQRHAIEALLKKVLYPRNLLAIRKIAIRLFLIFYQSLGVFGKATQDLDRVFQCLLPYFPLSDGQNSELVLQEYCHSAGTTHWSDRNMGSPPVPGTPVSNAKERAQMLQVYLDKFLEYCIRETSRIEWSEEKKRFECAQFIIDRVINLYIAECFTDIETNGVDIFGGWEGAEDSIEPLDTADPKVIARHVLKYLVPVESSSLLLINMLLSFFQSPYLLQAGDRLSSAITTSYAILRTCRDLVTRRHNLPRPLSVRVWYVTNFYSYVPVLFIAYKSIKSDLVVSFLLYVRVRFLFTFFFTFHFTFVFSLIFTNAFFTIYF